MPHASGQIQNLTSGQIPKWSKSGLALLLARNGAVPFPPHIAASILAQYLIDSTFNESYYMS